MTDDLLRTITDLAAATYNIVERLEERLDERLAEAAKDRASIRASLRSIETKLARLEDQPAAKPVEVKKKGRNQNYFVNVNAKRLVRMTLYEMVEDGQLAFHEIPAETLEYAQPNLHYDDSIKIKDTHTLLLNANKDADNMRKNGDRGRALLPERWQ